MDIVIYITVLFYSVSTAGYLLYLFIQKNYLHQIGRYLLITGFLWHSAAIVYWFIQTGAIPVHNLRETVTIAGWAVVGVFIIFQYKFNLKILGIYASYFYNLYRRGILCPGMRAWHFISYAGAGHQNKAPRLFF
jgi:ABC-type transport system involved in cytochrome c biogenesis permease subunit